jgi:hypothetical protein
MKRGRKKLKETEKKAPLVLFIKQKHFAKIKNLVENTLIDLEKREAQGI